jgi:3-hydroxyacyl-CoA dehydrogenase
MPWPTRPRSPGPPAAQSSERQNKIAEASPTCSTSFVAANPRVFKGFEAPAQEPRSGPRRGQHPLCRGRRVERQLFMELMSGTQAKAQQYFFFAERKAAKIEGVDESVRPREISKVGVIGAGTMGGGISMNFLSAGIPVTIVETSQEALDRGTGVMLKNYQASAKKGRFTRSRSGR